MSVRAIGINLVSSVFMPLPAIWIDLISFGPMPAARIDLICIHATAINLDRFD